MPRSFADAVADSSSSGGASFATREKAKSVAVDGRSVPQREFAQGIARLKALGGEHAKQANAILAKYGQSIDPEILSAHGLEVPKQDHSVLASFRRVGTGAMVGALDILGRPGQAALQAVQFGGGLFNDNIKDDGAGDIFGALRGKTKDGHLNLRSMQGLDPNGGGRLAGFFDTVGTIALDPVSYVTSGTRPLAEAGIKAIGEHVGEDAVEAVAKQGLKKGLSDAERGVLKAGLEGSEQAARANVAPSRLAGFLLPSERAIGRLAPEEQYAQRVLTATERSGQGGLRLAGFTVASGDALHAARVGAGVSDGVAAASRLPGRALEKATETVIGRPLAALAERTSGARETLGGMFKPRYNVEKGLGQRVADEVGQEVSYARAFTGQEADEVAHRITLKAKAAGVTDEEIKTRFLPALDKGGDVEAEKAALLAEGRPEAADLLDTIANEQRIKTRDLAMQAGAKPSSELDEVRSKAYAKAHHEEIEQATSKLPGKAERRAAQEARTAAEDAKQALGDLKADLSAKVENTAGPSTRSEIIRDHEMAKKVHGRYLKEGETEGWNEVRAIRQTEKAVEAQQRLTAALEDARMHRPGPLSHAESKSLGVAEERAAQLEKQAAKAERKITSAEAKVKKVMNGGAVKRANVAADQAVAKEARKGFYIGDSSEYVKRVTTDDGQKVLGVKFGKESGKGKSTTFQRALKQGGSAESRELYPELSILEANKQARIDFAPEIKAAGLDPASFDLYETDALKLTARRGVEAAFAAGQVKMVKGISEIKDDAGNAVLMIGKESKEEAKKLGYVSISSKYFDKAYAHPDIAQHLESLGRFLDSDQASAAFSQAIDKWGALWAGYATTPFIFGTGFFARNGTGNIIANTLAGVKGSSYVEASKLQRGISSAIKDSGHTLGPEFEAALEQNLGKRGADLVKEARRTGAIDSGFFTADMADHTLNALNPEQRTGLARLKPNGKSAILDRHNAVLEKGAKLNEVIETNARMAHFVHMMDKTGDAAMAASSVKKYLFDYADLTPFERTKMRRVVRFYTYMRKNTALQFTEMMRTPGKFAAMGHIADGLNSEGPTNRLLPSFAVNQGDVKLGNKLIGIDTPFSTAMQTVEPALQALAMVPGAKQLLPKSVRAEGGVPEIAAGVLNVPSGGPVEVLKFAAEEAFGKSLFSGAPIKTDSGSTATRFASALMPLFSKEKGTQRNILNSDGRDPSRARLLTTILGMHVTMLDDKSDRAEQYRQLDLVKSELKKLDDAGVDIPTIEELRDAGIIPTPKKAKSTTAKKAPTTAAQRKKAALISLADKGVKVP